MKSESVKNNYLYNMVYQLLSLITPLVTTPYVSRILGADGIGAYSFAMSISIYFSILGELGIGMYGQIQIADKRDNFFERSIIFWEVWLARVATTMAGVFLYCIIVMYFIDITYKTIYWILTINIVAACMDIGWFFSGLEKFKNIVTRSIIIKLLGIALIFVFVKDKGDLITYALILQMSTLIGNMFLWVSLKKYLVGVPIGKIQLTRHWKHSIPYFIPAIASTLYFYVDKTMIGLISNSAFENGYYEQALKIQQVALMVVTSLGTVVLPRMTYVFTQNIQSKIKENIDKAIRLTLCLSVPMSFGLMVISKDLVPCFLGNGYEKSIPILFVLSILIIISGLKSIIGLAILVPSKKQKKFNQGVVAGTIINIVFNAIFIPALGSIGAAVASVISEVVVLSIFLYYCKPYIRVSDILIGSVKYIMSAITMGSCVTIVSNMFENISWSNIAFEILVGIVVYVICLAIFREEYFISYSDTLIKKIKKVKAHA